MNIVLCGMMGVGKTTVGIKIARLTGRKFCDTDGVIVQKYGNISDIFAAHGEGYFRGLERQTIAEIASCDNLVVATGGGALLDENNVSLCKQSGSIVFLRAGVQTLVERLREDNSRPLLQSGEALSGRIEGLLRARTPSYERAADFAVDVDGKTPDAIAEEIVNILK